MKKRSIQSRTLGLLAVAVTLGAFVPPVDARTVPASTGKAMSGFQEENFSANNGAVFRTLNTGSTFWVVPIVFDNASFSSRTIRVHGMCPTNAQLTCSARTIKTDGTPGATSSSLSFPSNNTYTFVDLSLSSVSAGATGSVTCQFQGTASCMLLNLDYAP